MIKKSEMSTDVADGSSDFDAEWSAHWNTTARIGAVRQFAVLRIVQKGLDAMQELLPEEMQTLPKEFVAADELQWEVVSIGELPAELVSVMPEGTLVRPAIWEVLVFKGFLRVEYVFRGRKRVLWHNAATAKSFLIETRA